MSVFLSKVDDRSARICVVGLGYVGLPLAVAFAEAGFEVTGLDVDSGKVERLGRGESYIPDIPSDRMAPLVESGKLSATEDPAILGEVDSVHICVPTPLSKTRDPDVSYVINAADHVAAHWHPGMLIVLESTTYPGTTEEIMQPRFETDGRRAGEDFYLAFSPERIDPGNEVYTLANTPKVIGGTTEACTEAATALYGTICETVHPVSSPRAAELVKLLENTFRAINIALANEMAIMCDRLDIDTWEVVRAAATKPFGFMPFYPGPGLGGHCIPIDPHYLTWKVRTLDYQPRLIDTASEINHEMPGYVVDKVVAALNEHEKSAKGSRILMMGVAYKRDIDDVRESPAVAIMQKLLRRGAILDYHDPHVPSLAGHEGLESLRSVEGVPAACADYDCVIVGTDHAGIDWPAVIENSRLVVDTRNVANGPGPDHVFRL